MFVKIGMGNIENEHAHTWRGSSAYSVSTKALRGSGAPLPVCCAERRCCALFNSLPLRPAMLGAAGPMLRATATAQQDVAAAAVVVMQALGGVAVAGEVVRAAHRSCSRRSRQKIGETPSPGVGPPVHARTQSVQHNTYEQHVQA